MLCIVYLLYYVNKHQEKKEVLYKNMLIFREFFNTQSDQNIIQNAPNCIFKIFSGKLAYAFELPSICVQL